MDTTEKLTAFVSNRLFESIDNGINSEEIDDLFLVEKVKLDRYIDRLIHIDMLLDETIRVDEMLGIEKEPMFAELRMVVLNFKLRLSGVVENLEDQIRGTLCGLREWA